MVEQDSTQEDGNPPSSPHPEATQLSFFLYVSGILSHYPSARAQDIIQRMVENQWNIQLCLNILFWILCGNGLFHCPFLIALSLKMFFKIFYLSLILKNLIIIYLGIVFLLVSYTSWNLLSFME